MGKPRGIHSVACYSAMHRNTLLLCVTTCLKSQILQNKRSQTQQRTEWWLCLPDVLEQAKLISSDRNHLRGCLGRERKVGGEAKWGHFVVAEGFLSLLGWWLRECECLSSALWTGAFYYTLRMSMLHHYKCPKKRKKGKTYLWWSPLPGYCCQGTAARVPLPGEESCGRGILTGKEWGERVFRTRWECSLAGFWWSLRSIWVGKS